MAALTDPALTDLAAVISQQTHVSNHHAVHLALTHALSILSQQSWRKWCTEPYFMTVTGCHYDCYFVQGLNVTSCPHGAGDGAGVQALGGREPRIERTTQTRMSEASERKFLAS